jgi:hypothetical protein
MTAKEKVIILTPLKNAAPFLESYFSLLQKLSYPHDCLSIGFLESDSSDGTFELLQGHIEKHASHFRRVEAWKKDFGYQLPSGMHRGAAPIQAIRRTVLARSRNHLLFRALDDEHWVLWLDVDVIDYPADVLERLIASMKAIVTPNCVLDWGGPSFDLNAWRDQGKLHLDDLRSEGDLVRLDAVGGTMLLIRADIHREGLIFPTFLYGRENPLARPGRGEIETEGLGIMARDMGHQCWGMPRLEIRHARH